MTDNHKIVIAPEASIEQTQMHPLVNMAMKGGELDTTTLKELMELQKEWEREAAKKAFTQAMVQMKAELPSVISKDKSVSFGQGRTSYSFATLAHAMEIVQPHLTRYGFELSWVPSIDDKNVSVTCTLTHIDGHSKSTTLMAQPDSSGSKNPVQAIGSTVTYLERYTALALLGIATADMPDADNGKAPSDVVDQDRNLKAISVLKKEGIELRDAQAHLQKDFKYWTLSDLDELKVLIRNHRETRETDAQHDVDAQ